MIETPEHDKLSALGGANQIVGDFIEWLGEQGFCIAGWDQYDRLYAIHASRDKLIADHFGIDTNKLEAEKVQMLEELSK